MKVFLTQPDIETAVRNYLTEMMPGVDASTFTMTFSATRGADGLTADLTNTPVVQQSAVAAAVPLAIRETVRRARAPKETLASTLEQLKTIAQEPATEVATPLAEEAPFVPDEPVNTKPLEEDEAQTQVQAEVAEAKAGSLFRDPIAEQIAGSSEEAPAPTEKRASLFG